LGGKTGKFLCTGPVGDSPFQRHGPIRVARDRHHFEHADGTPFFWLADTVWNGARRSNSRDWQRYATIRSSQAFNVALWSVAPGEDAEYESALNGFPDRIGINPGFFQRLDAKLETLSRDGIMSAILPLGEPGEAEASEILSPDQAALFFRYVLARWGSEPVAWLIRPGEQSTEKDGQTWKAIEAVFANRVHAPLILLGVHGRGASNAAGDSSAIDAYGLSGRSDGTLQKDNGLGFPSRSGSLIGQRPIIIFAPTENGLEPHADSRLGAEQLRRIIYENLLNYLAAGVSYAGHGIADWNIEIAPTSAADAGRALPAWEKALFMPGAKQMRPLANLMTSTEFWRLRPQPNALAPGSQATNQACPVVESTDTKDPLLAYLPNGSPVEISLQAMPLSPVIQWLNPRDGSTRSASPAVTGQTCQLSPPADGDWLLIIKSRK
jgi:hypothetical protein